jgi:hypothetical protein
MPTPAQSLNIGTHDGQNQFNVGIGRPDKHKDYSLARIEDGFTAHPEFEVNAAGDAVRFRVRMDAKTTIRHAKFPRSELRELTADGHEAEWNGKSGRHHMQGVTR